MTMWQGTAMEYEANWQLYISVGSVTISSYVNGQLASLLSKYIVIEMSVQKRHSQKDQ